MMKEEDKLYQELSDTIKYQIEKLDNLDIYTSKHTHHVPVLVKKIGENLGFEEEKVKFYITCAYLHDIGKIFIPSRILQKAEHLTEEEYREMKNHTTYGYELCVSASALKKYAYAARSHHENSKGTGYPDQLAKEQIAIEAKIIQIADIYDALTSKRQYKKGYGIKETLNILLESVEMGNIDAPVFKSLLDALKDDVEQELSDYITQIKMKLAYI